MDFLYDNGLIYMSIMDIRFMGKLCGKHDRK